MTTLYELRIKPIYTNAEYDFTVTPIALKKSARMRRAWIGRAVKEDPHTHLLGFVPSTSRALATERGWRREELRQRDMQWKRNAARAMMTIEKTVVMSLEGPDIEAMRIVAEWAERYLWSQERHMNMQSEEIVRVTELLKKLKAL